MGKSALTSFVVFDRSLRKQAAAFFLVFIAVLLGASGPFPLRAEDSGSTLSGKITGASGSRIPAVHLFIRNTASGDTKTIVANQDGAFSVRNLSPGTYEEVIPSHSFEGMLPNN